MPKILIHRVCNQWPPIDKTVRRAAKAALAGHDLPKKWEMGIRLTDDAEITHLNRHYRNRDQSTNVLSFAMHEGEQTPHPPGRLLGDLVLAYETVNQEAMERSIPLEQHLAHLVVHGVLHLLGYDHARSPAAARKQEKREITIMARLGMKNPYRIKSQGSALD
jgi:probable rRNA maturation factor